MAPERQAVFLFVADEPSAVAIYPDLDWARESLESEDVASFSDQAFTADGQIVEVVESGDLFATFTSLTSSTQSCSGGG